MVKWVSFRDLNEVEWQLEFMDQHRENLFIVGMYGLNLERQEYDIKKMQILSCLDEFAVEKCEFRGRITEGKIIVQRLWLRAQHHENKLFIVGNL